MSSPKPHSPCTQFFSSTINQHKCALLIGHDDGSVSLINFEIVEGSLEYSHCIEQIHSETVLGFVECSKVKFGESAFVCWSGSELKIIDTSLKIKADLTSHVKDCGNIRGALFDSAQTLLVIMERGTVVKLGLGPEFSVSYRSEFELFRKRNQYGQVKLVGNERCSNQFYAVTWTDSYYTCFSEITGASNSKKMEVKMFAISPDGSFSISLIDNQTREGQEKPVIALLDLFVDNMPYIRTYPIPTEDGKDQQVLSVGFSELRYQALILTENRIVTHAIETGASYEITSQDLEEKFPTLTSVKFKFLTCTQHVKFLLLEEAGKVIVFNTSAENMEEAISVDKAFILSLPVHKKFTRQQSKLFDMAKERKLTNIEFCFIEHLMCGK